MSTKLPLDSEGAEVDCAPDRGRSAAAADESNSAVPLRSEKDRTPWRLDVVEAWFKRARAAGLRTAEERIATRNGKSRDG